MILLLSTFDFGEQPKAEVLPDTVCTKDYFFMPYCESGKYRIEGKLEIIECY